MQVYNRIRSFLPILLTSVALLALSKPTNFGDTKWYARNLLAYERRDFHESGSRLWEFGHLIERPAGYALYRTLKPAVHAVSSWDDYLTARTALVAISLISALALACLFQSLAQRAGASERLGFFIALAALSGNVVLTFATSGTSYIPSLLCLTIAVWLNLSAVKTHSSAVLAGVSLAISVLFWFPCVLSVPSVLLVGLSWGRSDWSPTGRESRERWRWCLSAAFSATGLILLVYAVALISLGIHSGADLRAWISDASHGWSQNRNYLRLAVGLARGFVSLEGGKEFKRYLLHDPYASVTPWELVRFGIWKLMVFYGAVICLAATLLRSKRGRIALALLVAGTAPVVGFALYFEAGSVERYLAIYPFFVIALTAAFADARGTWASRALVALLIVIGVVNVAESWRPSVTRNWSTEFGRIRILGSRVTSGGQAWLLGNDRLFLLSEVFPYDPATGGPDLPLEEIASIGNESLTRWREHFASRTLAVWSHGGQVWMTKRVLTDTPRPEWSWTEGDDPRISWTGLRKFCQGLAIAEAAGDSDGFVKLSDTPANRRYLEQVATQRQAPISPR